MKLSNRPAQRMGSWKRVIWYLILLAIILILIWQMPAIVHRIPHLTVIADSPDERGFKSGQSVKFT